METNWNQLIERYLNGELSAEGKAGFETELAKNPELKQEFELHQLTRDVIKRASTRNMVRQSAKSYHFRKMLTNTGIVVLIVAAIATAALLLTNSGSNAENPNSDTEELIETALLDEMNKALQFENIDPQYFKFTGENDIFLSESGVLLSITDNSFLLNGKPYSGEAVVQWQEAQKASEIIKAGLSTTSGNKLLETQGMFSLNAFTPEGKQLELSKEGIYVQVPVDELKKDMMLFNGVKGKNGAVDWQTPVELERLPKPKSMAKMDLFPPKYEPKLNELKWFTDKAKRDSLYLSFDEKMIANDSVGGPSWNFKSSEPRIINAVAPEPFNDGTTTIQEKLDIDSTFPLSAENPTFASNEPEEKTNWKISAKKTNNNEAMIIVTVAVDPGYFIPSLNPPSDAFWAGTELYIEKSSDYTIIGAHSEPKPKIFYDNAMKVDVPSHSGTFELKQKIKINNQSSIIVSGYYSGIALTNNEEMAYPFGSDFSVYISGKEKNHIPPSKVLAIWNKKFDNTILATQDFEDRMKAIHNTCDEKVFDVYANNLNEPLWKLDERVVKMGYPEFQKFADERVGKLSVSNEHQKNLQDFYEKALKTIQSAGKKNVEAALKKERQWDDEVQNERQKETMRKGLRESTNLNEEYGFNLQNVYKQLGVTAAFQMHGGGTIVNIDKYVMDATVARQSTLITDPNTGKTAKITYNPMKLEVKDAGKYDRLYVYLFSTEINSYQRLDFKNGKLDYNLNGDMNYTAAIIGINEDGYFFQELGRIKAEDLGEFSLKKISESEFDKRINTLNNKRMDKPMELKDELSWLFKEQANYVVQKKRREDAAFRNVIWPTIYSCGMNEMPELYYPQ